MQAVSSIFDVSFCWTSHQVKDGDIMNTNVITFRKLNQFDITGNVVTDQEHLHTIKVGTFDWRDSCGFTNRSLSLDIFSGFVVSRE
jgi:hypothetical protein